MPMEYRVTTFRSLPEPESIERAVLDADPAAVLDVGPAQHVLRIATSLDVDGLCAVLLMLGCDVEREQVTVLPSICCGGCSG